MDTSISVEGKSYENLMTSGFAEEKELGEKMAEVTQKIVAEIKPILKYVAKQVPILDEDNKGCQRRFLNNTRAVEIDSIQSASGVYHIFLGEDGEFFKARACGGSETGRYERRSGSTQYSWQLISLEKLVERLQEIFEVATQKREQHLASIRERSQKLDTVLAILKPEYR